MRNWGGVVEPGAGGTGEARGEGAVVRAVSRSETVVEGSCSSKSRIRGRRSRNGGAEAGSRAGAGSGVVVTFCTA